MRSYVCHHQNLAEKKFAVTRRVSLQAFARTPSPIFGKGRKGGKEGVNGIKGEGKKGKKGKRNGRLRNDKREGKTQPGLKINRCYGVSAQRKVTCR